MPKMTKIINIEEVTTKRKPQDSCVMGKNPDAPKRSYRAVTIAKMLDVSKGQIWFWAKNGTLPPPVKLSKQISVWDASFIDAFIENKLKGVHQ